MGEKIDSVTNNIKNKIVLQIKPQPYYNVDLYRIFTK